MKKVELDISERLHSSIILSAQKVGPTDALLLSKIFEKLKLNRSEELMIGLSVADGTTSWTLPEGQKPIAFDLEDEESRKLKSVLGAWTNYQLRDAVWVTALLKKLD